MKTVYWSDLTAEQQQNVLLRPSRTNNVELLKRVAEIITAVKRGGDEAVRKFTLAFDEVQLATV